MKRHSQPEVMVTDRLRSYGAALKEIGAADRQETRRWLNNRAENPHLPFQRRERAMLRFRRMRNPQKFAADHASVFNHFNQEPCLSSRPLFKANRTAALAERRGLCAEEGAVSLSLCRRVRTCLTPPLRTNPVVCLRGMPNNTFIVRHVWIPPLAQVISGSRGQ